MRQLADYKLVGTLVGKDGDCVVGGPSVVTVPGFYLPVAKVAVPPYRITERTLVAVQAGAGTENADAIVVASRITTLIGHTGCGKNNQKQQQTAGEVFHAAKAIPV